MDGSSASYNPSTYASTVAARQAIPSYIDIDVTASGSFEAGTLYIDVTAEQAPSAGDPIRIWSVIIEDHEIANSSWGSGYNGQEMMWIPIAYPLSNIGQILPFTGPYPQTLQVQGDYVLNPTAHPYDNLNVVTLVQYAASANKAVLNAHYTNLGVLTGIGQEPESSEIRHTMEANPVTGSAVFGCLIPGDGSGTVTVFDISGRVVASVPAQETVSVDVTESGVYFARLTDSSGESVLQQFTVIR